MRFTTLLRLVALISIGQGCAPAMSTTIPGVTASLESGLRDAKRDLDAGRRECAFALTETWRRRDPKEFERAFEVVFLGKPPFDASVRAEQALKVKLAAQPTDSATLIRLADIYISRADWKDAEAMLKRAIALRPDDVTPVAWLAKTREAQGDKAGANQLMEDFAARNPDSPVAILARLPADHGKVRRQALEEGVKSHPSDATLTFNLGAEVQESGDLAAAEALFVRAAELDRKSPLVQAWTGRFFLLAESKPKQALDYFFRAYFLDPDFYETEFVEARIARLATEASFAGCD